MTKTTEPTKPNSQSIRISFWQKLKYIGKKGKSSADWLEEMTEVAYHSTAIGYEKLSGQSHSRSARNEARSHNKRHKVFSISGTKLVNGTACHEYLSMDGMSMDLKSYHDFFHKKNNHVVQQMEDLTEKLMGPTVSTFSIPNVLRMPSMWFWVARVMSGGVALLTYCFLLPVTTVWALLDDGLAVAIDTAELLYNSPPLLVTLGLSPVTYLFFKLLHITGIENLFDPPFLTGHALRRDLGTLRKLNKKGEVFDIPFEEIEARTTTMWDGGNRAMCKLYMAHKYSGEGVVYGAPHKEAWYVGVLWEYLQHFMDVSRPLPDVPMLEPYRHLDPTTKAWDKKHNRPERLWRDMEQQDYRKLVRASVEVAAEYPFLKPEAAKEQNWQPAGDGNHWYQRG